MENIADTAQVSKRTLYKYFPNKEATFDELIEKQFEKITDGKLEMMTAPGYMDISRLVLSEVIKGRKLSEAHMAKFNESEMKFLKWIDAAKKDGKVKSKQSSELIANQVHSIVKGQVFYPVLFRMKDVVGRSEVKGGEEDCGGVFFEVVL